MVDTPTQQPNTQAGNGEQPGFFQRRWNMVKAAAKGVLSYLTKPRTYMFAAAAAGVGLLLANYGIGSMPAPGVEGFLMYSAKMLAIGTLIHMGIDMVKEDRKHYKQPAVPMVNQQGHAKQHSPEQQQAQYHPYDYQLDNGQYQAPITPDVNQPQQPGVQPPQPRL